MISFGTRLKDLRTSKNLNQSELGKVFNVERGTISNWENGNRTPDQKMIGKIADYFDVSVDYLFGRDTFDSAGILTAAIEQVRGIYLNDKEVLDIEKEAKQMIMNIDKLQTVEFCGTPADDEDKEYLKLAYEKFLTDVRIYNKQKYTPKKYR